jgi:hypothetical protein
VERGVEEAQATGDRMHRAVVCGREADASRRDGGARGEARRVDLEEG